MYMQLNVENSDNMELGMKNEVNIAKHRYPNCIVWTPLPIIRYKFNFYC